MYKGDFAKKVKEKILTGGKSLTSADERLLDSLDATFYDKKDVSSMVGPITSIARNCGLYPKSYDIESVLKDLLR